MKRNITLFGILLVLLVGTYLFQEKRVEKEHFEAEARDTLITNEITHLKLPHVEAEKRLGQWWNGTTLLSHNSFKLIEKKLSELRIIKHIEGDLKSYFPNPVELEINHEDWLIGDLSLDKQSFYLAKGGKVYLAVIEGSSQQVSTDEKDFEGMKLNELVSYLSKKRDELLETQLFRFYPSLPLERVVINVDGSLPFELNFSKNETVPPPIKGVHPHSELRGKFYSLLTQVTIKEEVPLTDKIRYRKLGDISFLNGNAQVTWELWLTNPKTADSVVIDSTAKHAYKMVGGTLKIFFVGIQDYWDKKVIPQDRFVPFSETQVLFSQGRKREIVTIKNKEPFEFSSQELKVQGQKMEQLIQIIFNLGPRDQAERVSHLSSSERKQLLSEDHLRIMVMDQELILWRKTQELIVANLTQGFKAHFTMLDENFRGNFQDVLQ